MTSVRNAIRIGQGWDIHALVTGRPLILGGITIPHSHGLLGHSDADALLHAITDALLGAAGMGDIGQHFPDNDPQYQGADSRTLLGRVHQAIAAAGWEIGNLDATIIAQAPKLAPHLPRMIESIAEVLKLDPSAINLKAKTAEGFGAVGRAEAIEVQAVVLLSRLNLHPT
ncbi:MAG: 2-C-methyl-D-erythritol 2,4-cyclodiphosphate synthase [Betaproteobacteria bacterium]|jgi:2-C-methyl-D-erythritol 2,4-cyclodiphosphate synthase|nr:2-C-methyl-D-erythritol 2,4-cyclodiphosphate synthase [Betaproteobacteria bacterium]